MGLREMKNECGAFAIQQTRVSEKIYSIKEKRFMTN